MGGGVMHPWSFTLWRYALGGLTRGWRQRVRRHALGCESCRRELSRRILARRALAGDNLHEPTSAEVGRWEAELLAAAAPVRRKAWLVGLFGAAVAAAALLLVQAPKPSGTDTLVARSGAAEPPFALRLLCVRDMGGAAPAEVMDPDAGPCPQESYLKVLVGGSKSVRRKLVVLLANGGELTPIYPATLVAAAPPLPLQVRALTGSWRLGKGPRTKVVAIASDESHLRADDPLLRWAATAQDGVYRDVFGRVDAVVASVVITSTRERMPP